MLKKGTGQNREVRMCRTQQGVVGAEEAGDGGDIWMLLTMD